MIENGFCVFTFQGIKETRGTQFAALPRKTLNRREALQIKKKISKSGQEEWLTKHRIVKKLLSPYAV